MLSVLHSRKHARKTPKRFFNAVEEQKKPFVFAAARVDIARKRAHHPQREKNKLQKCKHNGGSAFNKEGYNTANERKNNRKVSQLIVSVTTVKKSAEQKITSK